GPEGPGRPGEQPRPGVLPGDRADEAEPRAPCLGRGPGTRCHPGSDFRQNRTNRRRFPPKHPLDASRLVITITDSARRGQLMTMIGSSACWHTDPCQRREEHGVSEAPVLVEHHGPYTIADLEAMPDDGQRYELIDGALHVSPSPTHLHQRIAGRLRTLL